MSSRSGFILTFMTSSHEAVNTFFETAGQPVYLLVLSFVRGVPCVPSMRIIVGYNASFAATHVVRSSLTGSWAWTTCSPMVYAHDIRRVAWCYCCPKSERRAGQFPPACMLYTYRYAVPSEEQVRLLSPHPCLCAVRVCGEGGGGVPGAPSIPPLFFVHQAHSDAPCATHGSSPQPCIPDV